MKSRWQSEIFGIVPIAVCCDKTLSLNDLRVYIALASFQGEKQQSFPRRRKISERSGVHISHISKHTSRLKRFGYLEKIQRGRGISNVYSIVSKRLESQNKPDGQVFTSLSR